MGSSVDTTLPGVPVSEVNKLEDGELESLCSSRKEVNYSNRMENPREKKMNEEKRMETSWQSLMRTKVTWQKENID